MEWVGAILEVGKCGFQGSKVPWKRVLVTALWPDEGRATEGGGGGGGWGGVTSLLQVTGLRFSPDVSDKFLKVNQGQSMLLGLAPFEQAAGLSSPWGPKPCFQTIDKI